MKRVILLGCFAVIVLAVFFSCKKKNTQQLLFENIHTAASDYLQDISFDSLVIKSIDTITAMNYAAIMLEMLEKMEDDFTLRYREAIIFQDDDDIISIEAELNEIEKGKEFFFLAINQGNLNDTNILLYISHIEIYKDGLPELIILFMTTEFTVYEMDPFNNNLIDK